MTAPPCINPSLIRQYLYCPAAAYYIIARPRRAPHREDEKGKETQKEAVEAVAKALGAEAAEHSAQSRGAGFCGVHRRSPHRRRQTSPAGGKNHRQTPPRPNPPQSPARRIHARRPSPLRQGSPERLHLLRRNRRHRRDTPHPRPQNPSPLHRRQNTPNIHRPHPTTTPTPQQMPRMLVPQMVRHNTHNNRNHITTQTPPKPIQTPIQHTQDYVKYKAILLSIQDTRRCVPTGVSPAEHFQFSMGC
jgi:hypothetical protein